MNIKILHTEWSDGWGGQEIRVINEMIAVREQGVQVYLACRENSVIKQKAKQNDIEVFTLPFRGNVDFKTMFSLIRIIKKNNINIVNTHSGKDTWVGGVAAKLAGAKFIRTRHLSNRIRSSRLNFINELADYIFTTGESVRADMIKYNRIKPQKIISIPTGIDAEIFNPLNFKRKIQRESFGFSEDEIVIGIVAVLRAFKRHDLFLKAAKNIIENNKDKKLKFVIAGDGPQRNALEKLIKELNIQKNIRMLGHVKNVPELLSAMDIFVLTSDSKEGVPQSVMQALLMELPVVATDVGSTSDLYKDNNFILIKPDNIDAIVKAIEEFFVKDKRNNIREYIVDNFSKNVMTNKIIKIYNQLLL